MYLDENLANYYLSAINGSQKALLTKIKDYDMYMQYFPNVFILYAEKYSYQLPTIVATCSQNVGRLKSTSCEVLLTICQEMI